MNNNSTAVAATLIIFAQLLIYSLPAKGAGFDLICFTERPAIIAGESISLQAWASTSDGRPITTPIKFEWDVDAGRTESQGASAKWDLSAVKVGPETVRKVTATVKATQPGQSEVSCTVVVFIGKRDTLEPDRGTIQGDLISARHYLLPGGTAAPGFGLYSYLLFSAPPKNGEETARYLKTIEACLFVLEDVDEYLRRHVRPRDLNITYIPLKKVADVGKSNSEWAVNILATYDYATARILLNNVQQNHEQGPYLVSVLQPLANPGTTAYLWENLAGVVPELAWDWVRFFTYLAAQQRNWSEESLQRFGLTLRNLIAVGGKVTPDVLDAVQKAIQFTSK
jgi:hypothetical protein